MLVEESMWRSKPFFVTMKKKGSQVILSVFVCKLEWPICVAEQILLQKEASQEVQSLAFLSESTRQRGDQSHSRLRNR